MQLTHRACGTFDLAPILARPTAFGLALIAALIVAMTAGCGGHPIGPEPPKSAAPPPPPEIDAAFAGDGFSIHPPRDWAVDQAEFDWVVNPPSGDLESRRARAQIVITFESLLRDPSDAAIASPDDFREFCLAAIRETGRAETADALESGTTDAGFFYCDIEAVFLAEKGKSRHRFRNFYLPDTGIWRASASSWAGYWDRLSPMLLASLDTLKITGPPGHRRLDRPSSGRQ